MRYDVQVSNPDGSVSHFELEQDEPLDEGAIFGQGTMFYKAGRIEPSSSDLDGLVEAELVGGPGESGSS